MFDINYWNNFYKKEINLLPSQFAVFVASEYPEKNNIIDFGCGSARDTLFLSKFYKKVIGIDASTQIIAKNKKLESTKKNTVFLLNDLSNENVLIDSLNNELSEIKDCIFYARFFLHAIDEDTENKLLNLYKICKNNNLLALEFRTLKDKNLKKQFGNHFRRFIDLNHLIEKVENLKLKVEYLVEGQGYAKYKVDDAFVARMIII
jgi:SAM-dependent methyltransferase